MLISIKKANLPPNVHGRPSGRGHFLGAVSGVVKEVTDGEYMVFGTNTANTRDQERHPEKLVLRDSQDGVNRTVAPLKEGWWESCFCKKKWITWECVQKTHWANGSELELPGSEL